MTKKTYTVQDMDNAYDKGVKDGITKSIKSKMKVKVINKSKNPLPHYATEGSAGMDIYADLNKPLTVRPGKTVLVPTGLYMEIPAGYEAQIRPRSGLAYKHGLTIPNSPGTIDSDYRGEIHAVLYNSGDEVIEVRQGDRIAQMVVVPYMSESTLVDVLDDTERGDGGFGSTGR